MEFKFKNRWGARCFIDLPQMDDGVVMKPPCGSVSVS
jgi:hypothetical protein